ncbi:unnamed protein product [Penicillium olsonii]|nr:unnamed protein product [Penicillium olsonii]
MIYNEQICTEYFVQHEKIELSLNCGSFARVIHFFFRPLLSFSIWTYLGGASIKSQGFPHSLEHKPQIETHSILLMRPVSFGRSILNCFFSLHFSSAESSKPLASRQHAHSTVQCPTPRLRDGPSFRSRQQPHPRAQQPCRPAQSSTSSRCMYQIGCARR